MSDQAFILPKWFSYGGNHFGQRTAWSLINFLNYGQLNSDLKWMLLNCSEFFINEKLKKKSYFFTCILPDYVPHEITKEFWKNCHFENMTAGFLLRCQSSLRWEICMICHWNISSWKQKLSFGYVMVPKNNQKII